MLGLIFLGYALSWCYHHKEQVKEFVHKVTDKL